MFSRSVVMINTIRKFYCLYLYPLCKLATAIIAKPFFFNISESMHDNEITKNCVYIYIFMIRDWLRQFNSYKTYTFLFYANYPIPTQALTLSFCIHWPGGPVDLKSYWPPKSYWPEYCKENMLLPRCPLL